MPEPAPIPPAPGAAIAAAATILWLVAAGCSSLPSQETMESYYLQQQLEAQDDIAELRAGYHSGEISRDAFEAGVEEIRADAHENSNDMLFRDYQLRKSFRGLLEE
ncbi:MAG: hypothetical protein ACC661_03660 [Verrucomicrobiales bacterium]